MNNIIHVSFVETYRIGGVTFEISRYGPVIINRHTEKERDYRNVSCRNWAMIDKFYKMTEKERDSYRISSIRQTSNTDSDLGGV
jgi:hypothetical protein